MRFLTKLSLFIENDYPLQKLLVTCFAWMRLLTSLSLLMRKNTQTFCHILCKDTFFTCCRKHLWGHWVSSLTQYQYHTKTSIPQYFWHGEPQYQYQYQYLPKCKPQYQYQYQYWSKPQYLNTNTWYCLCLIHKHCLAQHGKHSLVGQRIAQCCLLCIQRLYKTSLATVCV